jgi:hypothetical protein
LQQSSFSDFLTFDLGLIGGGNLRGMEWIDLVQSTTGNILSFGRYLLVLHDTLLISVYDAVGQSTDKISINICIIQIQILRNP